MLDTMIEGRKHHFLPLAHRKTAHRIAVKPDAAQRLRTFCPQILVNAALLDTEQGMARTVAKGIARPLCPAHRQAHRHLGFFSRTRIGGAFIEGHDDVGPKLALDLH